MGEGDVEGGGGERGERKRESTPLGLVREHPPHSTPEDAARSTQVERASV